MPDIRIDTLDKPFTATFSPPGSKSLTNRALVLAALADGTCDLSNVLFADDTHVMLEGLMKLGFHLVIDHDARTVRVSGRGGHIDRREAEIFCGNSGTTIRFLTALCALGDGTFILDGIARMRQRPIGALTGMLKNLGVRVGHSPEAEGFPPIHVEAHGMPGGHVRYGSEVSSQYLSAILMIAPYARNEVHVHLDGPQTSWPYVAMTMQLMDTFGVTPELIRDPKTAQPTRIIVPQGKYAPTTYDIEPDASNATYFLALAALHPGAKVTIEGLGRASLQGDVGFADVLHQMGADLVFGKDFLTIKGTETLEGIDINLADMPDTAQTLAVVALFARGETVIRGLHTLRVKETDRLLALSNELKKFGAEVEIEDDILIINPPEPGAATRAEVDTYDDHRMAMSFALAGTKIHGVVIKDAQCVNKTYPQFFDDLKKVTSG
ncbi:MAG: 3-phosphoshikimate 1-carboxyvinyltransferase [Phycisphaerales bacterium]|jgi:3-phosphoshikimate 1-carboxyvinyltransferase|nr:3-phosphoshikimate 1-carboxyvinyltransferase [Phycisphaerales bacterium]